MKFSVHLVEDAELDLTVIARYITHFREIRFKPYRIIYEIVDEKSLCPLHNRRQKRYAVSP